MNDLLSQASEVHPFLVKIRRELHRNPELSMQEFETTERIRNWLREAGVPLVDLGLPVGVVAEVAGAQPGPTVVVRADIDALPIHEQTDLPYASLVPGRMHACGHDFHTSTVLGAAMLLKGQAANLHGRVRFLFQPAEETMEGARAMIQAGALDNVDAIFGLHNKPDLPVGTVVVRPGPLMASCDRFLLTVTGKGGHAGLPHQTTDPIIAASALVTALQSIVSRNVNPLHSAVVTVGVFQSGSAWNIIPNTAVLEGTVRTLEPELRGLTLRRLEQIVRHVGEAYGIPDVSLTWMPGVPAVRNDPAMTELVHTTATSIGMNVINPEPIMGSEDFSLYLKEVPGCFVLLGTDGAETWHHPRFTVNEEALASGAALMAQTALSALEKLG